MFDILSRTAIVKKVKRSNSNKNKNKNKVVSALQINFMDLKDSINYRIRFSKFQITKSEIPFVGINHHKNNLYTHICILIGYRP